MCDFGGKRSNINLVSLMKITNRVFATLTRKWVRGEGDETWIILFEVKTSLSKRISTVQLCYDNTIYQSGNNYYFPLDVTLFPQLVK